MVPMDVAVAVAADRCLAGLHAFVRHGPLVVEAVALQSALDESAEERQVAHGIPMPGWREIPHWSRFSWEGEAGGEPEARLRNDAVRDMLLKRYPVGALVASLAFQFASSCSAVIRLAF